MKKAIIDFWKIGFQAFPLAVSLDASAGRKRLDWKPAWGEPLSLSLVLDWLDFLGTACNSIAIKTGQCSNLFVVDLDVTKGKNGGAVLERHGITIPENTVSVQTQSNGFQYYFTFPAGLEHSTGADLFEKTSGIDIRGDGGFVIAPPSQVMGGGNYSWIMSPFEYPLAPVPENFLKKIIAARSKPGPSKVPWKQGRERRLSELSEPQKRTLMKKLNKCRIAEVGFRSGADFEMCCWAVCISLAVCDLWELCRDMGKFKERGRAYFDLTYNNALKTR
jgi:hypothetical protein